MIRVVDERFTLHSVVDDVIALGIVMMKLFGGPILRSIQIPERCPLSEVRIDDPTARPLRPSDETTS